MMQPQPVEERVNEGVEGAHKPYQILQVQFIDALHQN